MINLVFVVGVFVDNWDTTMYVFNFLNEKMGGQLRINGDAADANFAVARLNDFVRVEIYDMGQLSIEKVDEKVSDDSFDRIYMSDTGMIELMTKKMKRGNLGMMRREEGFEDE